MLYDLAKMHPYCEARRLFTRNKITKEQAIAMLMQDADFVTECQVTLNDRSPKENAIALVNGPWLKLQYEHVMREKCINNIKELKDGIE